MKTRILCLIDSLGLGGAQRQIIGLVSQLREAGYAADLAVYHDRDFYAPLLASLQIEVIKLQTSGSRWSKLMAVKNLIKEQKYDVVITYMTGPNVIGSLLKWMGLSFRLIVSDRTTRLKRTFRDDLIYAICRRADYIVPNSYSQANFIKQHYPRLAHKVCTITNFTDQSFTPAEPPQDRRPIELLGAGRLSWEKNLLTLVRAMRLLKDRGVSVRLTWYGDTCRMNGSDECKQQVEALINELGLQKEVLLFPATKQLIAAYHACDALCLPSFSEGFPNVICEAMSCGKPILCSDVCDNPHIVDDGYNGLLFSPEKVELIADAIERFCSLTHAERLQMGARSRVLAEQRFSAKRFVERYIALIEG